MRTINIPFILLNITTVLILLMFVLILAIKKKKQIHYAFLLTIILMFIWSLGYLLEAYTRSVTGFTNMLYVYIWNAGLCLSPVSLLLLGIIFAKSKIKIRIRLLFLFILPVVSYLLLLTNDYHHLFFKIFSPFNDKVVYGPYFFIHSVYSYVCIILGLAFLIYFSIKNSGFFSKQSVLIIIGTIFPLMVNIAVTTKLLALPAYTTAISFSFAILCYTFAILRYNFLSITPVAMQSIVDQISDSFVVINEGLKIVDFNKTFSDTFSHIRIKRNSPIEKVIQLMSFVGSENGQKIQVMDILNDVITNNRQAKFELHIKDEHFDKYFSVEITPLVIQGVISGTIILFKDITQAKLDLDIIKENQAILLEQERLASLGQLIGGIAHNLKTPIMSISGGIEALKDLTLEYRDSIDDRSVTEEDHKEIANEMLTWLDKMKPYCAYMSDVITAVKGQAVQMNDSSTEKFTVYELIKRVDLLMKHELKVNHCILKIDSQIDMKTEIKGEVNNLVQVFDNIIINAVHAYEGKDGIIELRILRSGDNVEFFIKDYAKGIPKELYDRLFKEMVTTKGKNGTGLGLYMSYSTIKGRFGGNLTFTSKQGIGTEFFLSIPCISQNRGG